MHFFFLKKYLDLILTSFWLLIRFFFDSGILMRIYFIVFLFIIGWLEKNIFRQTNTTDDNHDWRIYILLSFYSPFTLLLSSWEQVIPPIPMVATYPRPRWWAGYINLPLNSTFYLALSRLLQNTRKRHIKIRKMRAKPENIKAKNHSTKRTICKFSEILYNIIEILYNINFH